MTARARAERAPLAAARATGRTPALDPARPVDVTFTFVNDAVMDGAGRNGRVEAVRLRCEGRPPYGSTEKVPPA